MNPRDPAKIGLGLFLVVVGTWLSVRHYPTPASIIMPAAHPGVPMRPGQDIPMMGLSWDVFLGYFRLLLAMMCVVNVGAFLLYSGASRPEARKA